MRSTSPYPIRDINPPITSDHVTDNYLDAQKSTQGYRPAEIDRAALLDMMKHQLQLEWSFQMLKDAVNAAKLEDMQQAIEAAGDTVAAYRAMIVDTFGEDVMATMPTTNSGIVAQQIFDIPELAENILYRLPPAEILRAMEVGRAFAGAIRGSPKIGTKLQLRPNGVPFWRSLFDNGSSVRCNISGKGGLSTLTARPGELVNTVTVIASCGVRNYCDEETHLPRVGSLGRAMLICQPPIHEMDAVPSCCGAWRDFEGVYEGRSFDGSEDGYDPIRYHSGRREAVPNVNFPVIRSATGLTVGHLLDATSALKKQHRLCAFARVDQHDMRTGEVNVSVEFIGTMTLLPEDPSLTESANPRRLRSYTPSDYDDVFGEDHPRSRREHWDAVDEYVATKRRAVANGQPIPTFEEFQAAAAPIEDEDVEEQEGAEDDQAID